MRKYFIFIGLIGILLLKFQCYGQNPELTLQTGHSGGITSFAFSNDGKYLASVGKDNLIIFWDFILGKQLKIFKGHTGKINSIKFLNHSYNIISAGDDGKVICWDTKSGNVINSINLSLPVYSIDVSKNDSLLAIAGRFPEIKLWKIKPEWLFLKNIPVWDKKDSLIYVRLSNVKGKKTYLTNTICTLLKFRGNNQEVIATRATKNSINNEIKYCESVICNVPSATFSKICENANAICFANKYQDILLSVFKSKLISYNIIKNKINYTKFGNFKKYNFLLITVNANDSLIASLNEDGLVYVWKNDGKYLKTINQPAFNTSSIIFNPIKENLLILGDDEGSISVFDINSGNFVKKLESGIHSITNLAINNSGTLLAIGSTDNLIRTFELNNKIYESFYSGHKNNISGLNFVTDSSFVSTSFDNRICAWNVNNKAFTEKIKGNSNPMFINALINSPILSLFANTISAYYFANNFLLHNYESLNTSAFNVKRNILATGGNGFNKGILYNVFVPRIFPIHIVNFAKMKKVGKLKAHYISINSIDFNNSGNLLASCGNDYKTGSVISRKEKNTRHSAFPKYYSLKIWDVEKQNELKTFENKFEIKSLKFNNVNDTIFFTDAKNNVVIFDYKNDSARKISDGCGPILIDAKGKNVFFQDNSNSLLSWDLKQNAQINIFKGHNNKISSAVFFPNGKQIATASLDGTIKIWDSNTGAEVATLYAINNDDFIVKTPDYFYYATKNAKKEIGFTFGIKFYPFEQFDLQYNRPDIVMKRLGIASDEIINAYYMAYQKRLKKMGFSEEMFANDFHLPEIEILNLDKLQFLTQYTSLNLIIKASDNKYKLNRINVWVNNVPVYGVNGINLRNSQIDSITKEITVELSPGNNTIQLSCLNEKGVESLKETFVITCNSSKNKKPNLYIIAIGASEYQDKEWNLNYAAKDANDFSDLFSKQKINYENVYVNKLLNKDVTIYNIRKLKQKLMQTNVDDVVMLFYAGHGLLDDSLDYYLATNNINFNKPSLNGLKYDELDNLLDSIPARNKILFIDACHSGEVDKESGQQLVTENVVEKDIVFRGVKPRGYNSSSKISYNNSFELMKEMFSDLRKGTGAVVVSSAGGGEYAFEGESWKNGVFTYSLLNGINTFDADKNNDYKITISELQNYVMTHVQMLTNGMQKPTMRQENIENDFVIWRK